MASSKCEHKKVAFFVGQSKSIGPVCQNTDLVFDNVVTNIGSAYCYITGRFKAPVAATYHFNICVGAQQTKKAALALFKNGYKIMTVWAESIADWSQTSNAAILKLEAGDQVWVQMVKGASDIYGNMYTSFSGFLIFED